ncbi:sugar porter family MFS transporter [Haloferula sp.]|uniref:sugar porter family MFS transporter n=1 Tax=Haloferula sp. TaxID=2497595 RepID=UPI003C7746CC
MKTQPNSPVGCSRTRLYMIALIAATGGFLFGYDLSIISGAMIFLGDHFQLDSSGKGIAMSSAILGSILGPLVGMWLNDKIGRRSTLWVAAICFMISAIGTALPRTLFEFCIWRGIGGIGVGLAAMTSPMYIAEISPPHLRGRLVTVNQLAIVIGINLAVIASYLLSFGSHWRWMFASEVLPILALALGLFFVPRSPRWLASKGREEEALAVLESINGTEQAERELAEIHAGLQEETGSFRQLLLPGMRKAMVIGLLIMIFSQINGVNMMLLYGPSILHEAGIGDASQSIFFTIFLNLVILVSTIIAFWLVQRFGRRPIMIWGVTAMAAGHLIMAGNFFLGGSPFINLLAMFVAAGAFTLSLAPLSWVIVSEIFPNQLRAKAVSIVCAALYLSSFLCAQFFPMITEAFQSATGHPGGAYIIFAGICGTCVLVCWKFLPETKDLTLENIGRFWKSQNGKRADGRDSSAQL